MKEVDLGKHILAYFKHLNYKIYQEVDCNSRGIDAVGVHKDTKHIITIELKVNFNLKVIEQAYDNRLYSHYSYLAVPSAKHHSSRYFALQICRDYGIGVIEWVKSTGQVREIIPAVRNSYPEKIKLFEDKDSYSLAGSPDGKRWTPFKQTCVHIVEYVKNNPACSVAELVKNIEHHYSSPNSARSTIRNRIRAGIIQEIKIIDNKLYLS